VAFIEETRNRAYNSQEEAFLSMQWMFDDLTPREKEKLKTYLKEYLVLRSGSWMLTYDKVIRWAVMWWEKR